MSKQIRITYYGMDGEGSTVKEAKQDAGSQIESALKRLDKGIKVVQLRERIGIVYPTRDGFAYRFNDSGSTHHVGNTIEECERSMRRHAAQNAMIVPTDPAMDLLLTDADKREHQAYFDWQVKCRQGLDQGMDDEQARRYASGF